MASRRKITKQKRRNKRVKLIITKMRNKGIHVNRETRKQLRAK